MFMRLLSQCSKKNAWFAVILLALSGGMVSFAQEPIVPAAPPPMSPEELALDAQRHEERRLDIESRQPSDFRIAYLAAPGSSLEHEISATFAALPITTWEDFLSLQDTEDGRSQIILIDQSALDFVDVEWTREAYRSQVILAGIDVTYDDMVQLTGDMCINDINRNAAFEHQFWIFRYSYTVEIDGEPQEQIDDALKQILDEVVLETCTLERDVRITERPESVLMLHGFSFRPMWDEMWMDNFVAILMQLTYAYGMPNPNIQ